DDGKLLIAEIKPLAALRNEAKLIENETADGGVSWILGQRDVVLRVEVAHVEGSVKNHRPVRKRERLFHHVKLVVNFANHLFDDIFDGHQAENAAEFVDDHGQTDAARAQFEKIGRASCRERV